MAGMMREVDDIHFRVATVSGNFRRGGFAFGVVATVLALSALTPAPAAAILTEQKLQVEIGDGDQFVMLNAEQRETLAEVIAEAEYLDDLDLEVVLRSIMMEKPDEESPADDQAGKTDKNSAAGAQSGSADEGGTGVSHDASAGAGNGPEGSTAAEAAAPEGASPAPTPTPAATSTKPTTKRGSRAKTAKKPAAKSAS